MSNEKEVRELHANGAHGETELPDETELPNETELPVENGQRGEPSLQSVWGSDFPSHMKKLTLLGNVSP